MDDEETVNALYSGVVREYLENVVAYATSVLAKDTMTLDECYAVPEELHRLDLKFGERVLGIFLKRMAELG